MGEPWRDKRPMAEAPAEDFSVLFVCAGCTCRSPMAAGLTRALSGGRIRAESAGIRTPPGRPPEPHAVKAMGGYGVDMSDHRSSRVQDLRLDSFSLVIALDSSVYNQLLPGDFGIDPSRLVCWEIEDPYGQGEEAYRRCAQDIRGAVLRLIADEPRGMPPPTETILGDGKGTGELPVGLSAAVAELRADLVRWRQELGEGGTGTWVAGVAASAQWQLDPIARKLLAAYVEASGAIDYARDTPVRRGKTDAKPGKPRPIGKLSLGQTVQCFEKFDGQLTEWCRASGRLTEGETLARHGRPDDPLKRVLDLRNPMAHPEETGKEAGRQGLARRTLELLDAMEEALAMPLFQIGASL